MIWNNLKRVTGAMMASVLMLMAAGCQQEAPIKTSEAPLHESNTKTAKGETSDGDETKAIPELSLDIPQDWTITEDNGTLLYKGPEGDEISLLQYVNGDLSALEIYNETIGRDAKQGEVVVIPGMETAKSAQDTGTLAWTATYDGKTFIRVFRALQAGDTMVVALGTSPNTAEEIYDIVASLGGGEAKQQTTAGPREVPKLLESYTLLSPDGLVTLPWYALGKTEDGTKGFSSIPGIYWESAIEEHSTPWPQAGEERVLQDLALVQARQADPAVTELEVSGVEIEENSVMGAASYTQNGETPGKHYIIYRYDRVTDKTFLRNVLELHSETMTTESLEKLKEILNLCSLNPAIANNFAGI